MRDAGFGAALFHATLAEALAEWAYAAATREGICHHRPGRRLFRERHSLRAACECRLVPMGISVLEAREAPANDGGIALGQAWVAMRKDLLTCASPFLPASWNCATATWP